MGSVSLLNQKVAPRQSPEVRAYLADWSQALEMNASGDGAAATECGYCERYDCGGGCPGNQEEKAADRRYDAEEDHNDYNERIDFQHSQAEKHWGRE